MSKRQIESALRKKGLVAIELYYSWQVTPGEMVPCWYMQLDDDSEGYLFDNGFDSPDFFDNSKEVLEWISSLPTNATTPAAAPERDGGVE